MATEQIIGNVEDFPVGTHKVVKIGNREIGVFHTHDGFYALPNLCPHQVGPLCTGKVSGTLIANEETNWIPQWCQEGEIVTCPWHGLEFQVKTGQCLHYSSVKLRTYPVTVEQGQIKLHA